MRAAAIAFVFFLASSANAHILPQNCQHDCEYKGIKVSHIMRDQNATCPIQPSGADLANDVIRNPNEVCDTERSTFVVCNYCSGGLMPGLKLASTKIMTNIVCNDDLDSIDVATCEEATEAPASAPVARRAPNERSAPAKRALPLMEAPAARRAPKERSAPAGTSGTAFNIKV